MITEKRLFLFRYLCLLLLFSLCLVIPLNKAQTADGSFSFQQEYTKIPKPSRVTYSRNDSLVCKAIVRSLERHHYTGEKLTDDMSSKILDRYLSMLDPSKDVFIRSDIKEFEQARYLFDNALKGGDLSQGYYIYNRYLERSYDRLTAINTIIENWKETLDFSVEDSLILNRETLPWPMDEKELRHIWEQEIKNTILGMKLQNETIQDITQILKKRYVSRLNRLSRAESADAFRTFMNAVAMSYDPHTQYFPPRLSEDFDIQMSLSLEGIGAVLQTEYEYTKVIRLISAGPAEKSEQLMPGDKIIGVGQDVDGEIEDVVGWRIDEVVNLIRGPKGTIVRLQIVPAEQKGIQNSKIVSIKRDKVNLEEQAAQKQVISITLNGQSYKIGIIDIPTFYLDFKGYQAGEDDYRSTTRDVRKLIQDLESEKIDGLIIDLRDNGGGSLQEANKLAGLFITSGPTVQIKSRNGYLSQMKDPDPDIIYSGPLVVMINRMSASASEIFAGAIQDYNRGVIVGTQTFGKGTVQGLESLSDGQLKLTSAKFYRVSGQSTQNMGILPDIAYPKMQNSDEVGESALDGALPWDTSSKAAYTSYKSLDAIITKLQSRHDKRTDSDPGFIYLKEKYSLLQDLYLQKEMPLNESKRKEQTLAFNQRSLKIENDYLKARGIEPLKDIEALNTKRNLEKAKNDKDDILLKETEFLMADFIELSNQYHLQW